MDKKSAIKTAAAFILAALFASLFTACSAETEEHPPQSLTGTYADYIDSGMRFAVQLGGIYGEVARNLFKAKEVQEYTKPADMLESLHMGRVDAILIDASYVKPLEESGSYTDIDYLWVPEDVFVNESASIFHTEDLRDKYNEWLALIKADGTLDEITGRWIGVPLPNDEDIPRFELTGENGTLRVCDTADYPPFTYYDGNGELVGFDTELAYRFAEHLGMKLEASIMSYDAILPYVISGRADMSACNYAITEERKQSMIFGDPCIVLQSVVVVPKGASASAGTASAGANAKARDYTDFAGKDIAVLTGVLTYNTTERIGAHPVLYNDSASAAEEVRQGRVDGYMHALTAVQVMAAQLGEFEAIPVPKEIFSAQIGGISIDPAVIDSFNAFLAAIAEDGTLAEMQRRWFSDALDLDAPLPDIPNSGANGVLSVAICSDSIPYVYVGADGQYSGFSTELALRFGAHEGKTVEFADMEFGGLIPYIVSQRADIALANMAITEERKESVLFTEPFFDEQHGILALKQGSAAGAVGDAIEIGDGGFIDWLKTGIERNLITDSRWKMIVNGLGVTMTISVFAQLFGTMFGCFVCWVLMRKHKFANWFGRFYCGLIHGTPVVVLLMITYYIIFGSTAISNVVIAIAAFTLVMGANVAQNLKGAIDTVDPMEIEAARSIGFPAWRAFLTVTLPQAVRRALPGYTNGFVELVKATAVVGYIAIQDLTRAGDIIRSRTYDAYFPLLLVAAIYLIVTTICVQLFKVVVKKANGGSYERVEHRSEN